MKATTNYNIPLYEPNDLANLTDGYNNGMEIIDTSMKAVEDFVQTYDKAIEDNAAAIASESERATAAEKVNADAIAAETNRATAAEKANADAIAAETNRATAAEKANADAIVKNVLIIGDSYTEDPTFYVDKLKTIISNKVRITFDGKSSTGFVRETSYGAKNSYQYRALDHANDSISYDLIILYGFVNDYNNSSTHYSAENQWGYITATQETNAIKATVDNLKNGQSTKNAAIVLIENFSSLLSLKTSPRSLPDNAWDYWVKKTNSNVNGYKGLAVYSNTIALLWFCGSDIDGGYKDDNVHPNSTGGYVIASAINGIINGNYTFPSWITNKWVSDQTKTINNVTYTFVRNSVYIFNGNTLQCCDYIESPQALASAGDYSIDPSEFIYRLIYTAYSGTYEVMPYKDDNTLEESSMYWDSTEFTKKINMKFRCNGNAYSRFYIKQTIQI